MPRDFVHRLLAAGGETQAAQFSRWGFLPHVLCQPGASPLSALAPLWPEAAGPYFSYSRPPEGFNLPQGARNRTSLREKGRGDGLERRPPVGTAARRAAGGSCRPPATLRTVSAIPMYGSEPTLGLPPRRGYLGTGGPSRGPPSAGCAGPHPENWPEVGVPVPGRASGRE